MNGEGRGLGMGPKETGLLADDVSLSSKTTFDLWIHKLQSIILKNHTKPMILWGQPEPNS